MRRENRLLFAAQKLGRFYRDTTKHLIFGIDQPPFAVDFVCFGGKRLHRRLKKGTEATGHGGRCQPMAKKKATGHFARDGLIRCRDVDSCRTKERDQSTARGRFSGLVSAGRACSWAC